jgi:hypothetical protein
MSSSNQYASIHELDENDFQSLDYGLLSTSTVAGAYTASVQTVFGRHATEIRAQTEPITQPLHQISKRRIRELIAKHNNDLFGWMAHPERTPNPLGIADSIFRKYSRDLPFQRTMGPISRELNLDVSNNTVLETIEKGLNSLSSEDASGTAVHTLIQQLKWVFTQYKVAGEEVMRLEALLTQKTETLDKLQQRQGAITNLVVNDSLPQLLDSFGIYMSEVFEKSNFEQTYKDLVEAYKLWHILREIISLQQIGNGETREPLCAICLTDPVTHTIAPCGHTFCTACVRRVNTTCYLCRGAVRERVKLFFT